MTTDEKLFLIGAGVFILSQDKADIEKMLSMVGGMVPGTTPQKPLELARGEYDTWQTYTTQEEKNKKIEQYFLECGYGGETRSWAWCQAFVSAMCKRAGLQLLPGEKQFISTTKCMDYYKQQGLFKSVPEVGDFGIMALNDGQNPNHVGFVSKIVDVNSHVQFLEGNYSGGVAYVERKNTLPKVLGYITPKRG